MARHDVDINLRVDLTEGDITNTANKMAHRIERIFGRSLASGKLSTSTKSLLTNLDKGYNKILQLTSALDRLKNTQIDTEQYKTLETNLANLRDRASELIEPLKEAEMLAKANPKFQGKFNKLQEQVQANQRSQEDVLKQIRELEDKGQAQIRLADTDEGKAQYARLLDTLKATNDQMVIYTERAREAKDLGPNLGVWSDFLSGVFNANHGLGRFLATLTRVGSVVVKGGITLLQSALGKIGSAAKTAAKHLAEMAKNLIKVVGGSIIGKLKSLGSAITGIGKKTRSSNNAFNVGFKTLLRYGLGIRSVYFLFRKLRKALGEGLGNLAQYSPAFNTVISNFLSSLTQLKNAFATAFAPIINVVAPILTTFINIVSEAVTKVGMLIAALTGQKTFIRAKAVQTDFAASLDKSSKSTDKANKSAEKYKRTIAGFDDVEILKSPDSNSNSGGSGGGGGSGNGGVNPSDMFETVAMPSAFEDWAARIKEAWAKADFTDLGKILGEKIANALDSIPWDIIKGYAGKFGKSFATFLNGLMAVDENGNSHLATSIGKTIGEAVNTVFTFANEFVSNIDGSLVGNFFADLLNSAINTINWELIADTLVKGINKIFSNAKAFADKFKFDVLGTELRKTVVKILNGIDWSTISGAVSGFATGLAKFVNKLITPESFGAIGTTIANALNTAINGVHSFAVTFDSKNLGESIASAINNFFSTFDFEKAGITFGTVITKVGEAITTAVSGVEWQDIGKDLTGFIFSIPWSDVFGTASELATTVSTAAGEALGGVAQGIFDGIQKAIDKYFKEHEGETGGQIALGIIKEIGGYFWKILNWPVIYVVNPIISGIKSAFGIHSPATNPKLLEAARNIGKGILNGIAEAFGISGLIKWAQEHLLKPLTDAFGKAKEKGSDVLNFLNDKKDTVTKSVKITIKKITNKAGDAWEFVKSGKETIEKKVETVLEKVGDWKDEAWQAVKDGKVTVTKTVRAVLQEVGRWAGDVWESVKEGTKTFTKTIQIGLSIIDKFTGDVWNAVKSGKETIVKTLSVAKDKTFDTVKTGWESIKSKSARLTAGALNTTPNVLKTLKDAWQTIKDKTSTLTGKTKNNNPGVMSTLKDAWKTIKDKTATLVAKAQNKSAGVVSTIKTAWNNLKDKAVTLRARAINYNSSVLSKLKDAWQTIKSKTVTLKAKLSGLSDSILRMLGLKKASGGVYVNGKWSNIPQYAKGGNPHGTAFIAGERGPEIVGHIGGRTEVLNQSQLAAVMYNAVLSGTSIITKSIMSHMTVCTNAVITNLGALLAVFNFTTSQIYDITNLVNKLNGELTDIVSGKVVPTKTNSDSIDLMKALNTIIQNQNNVVTREELQDILTDAFRRYMNIDFYLGDEQIARHANAGNLKLNRRYGTL